MLAIFWACWRAAIRFRDYKPQRVTYGVVREWLSQFEKKHRKSLCELLSQVVYKSESEIITIVSSLNNQLIRRLENAGIRSNQIIYMSIDAAGSSSHFMLNLLRDTQRLERRGCILLDSYNVAMIKDLTYELGEGAIIYVDDFIGTGKQFIRTRKRVSEYVLGNFSEFLLAPCICEEALKILEEPGVEPISGIVHLKKERPLHPESNWFDETKKKELSELCLKMHQDEGLGFKKMATMVAFFRNSPNTMPLILRGNLNQKPLKGVLPRTTDLPVV